MAKRSVELGPGVFRIPTLGDYINSFAFVADDGQVTLVDCGLKRAPTAIVRGLESIGKRPYDVSRIILTHAHSDHAGGAHRMVELTSAAGVDVHEDDIEFVRAGHNPPVDTSVTMGRLFERSPNGKFEPFEVSTVLHDGEVIAGDIAVMHTPGHTPGHISLLHKPSGVLITGDAIFNMRHRMSWPLAVFCTSAALNQQSAQALADADYQVAAFTHGPEIRDNARESIRDFIRRKSKA